MNNYQTLSTCDVCGKNRGHGNHAKCAAKRKNAWIEHEMQKLRNEKALKEKQVWSK